MSDTDTEDVVWALQTADALWKRNERIDAIVWLRRAAQAAGEADDDERAVALARDAAELSELVASTAPDTSRVGPNDGSQATAQIDDLLHASARDVDPPQEETLSRRMLVPSQPTEALAPPSGALPRRGGLVDPSEEAEETRPSVRTADQVHAGMLDPWAEVPAEAERIRRATEAQIPRMHLDDDEVITSARLMSAKKAGHTEQEPTTNPSLPIPRALPRPLPPRPTPPTRSSDKMAAAPARGETPSQPREPVASQPRPPLPSQPRPPFPSQPRPPLPSQPRPPLPSQPLPSPRPPLPSQPLPSPRPPLSSQPRQLAPQPRQPVSSQPRQPIPSEPRQPIPSQPRLPAPSQPQPRQPVGSHPRLPTSSQRVPASEPISVPISVDVPMTVPTPPPALDLSSVQALGDLPDVARIAFARIAKVTEIGREEEVSTFALAYVISGEVDVSATMVDAPAIRCTAGSILRGRGSISDSVALRLIGVSDKATVATWKDEEVVTALRGCPWVDEDLRAAADRCQALAGVTVGPLGERLDRTLRDQVMSHLELRVLRTGDVVVEKGRPVPGLVVVGVGELELIDGDVVKDTLSSGEFLFAEAVLGAGPAPLTARAGKGGVLALLATRAVAQELLVTCPPLLEVLAGM